MVYWEPSHEPWCSPRSPGGGLRVSGSSCGRRGAPRGVSRIHLRPSGHHFFIFCGIGGRADRIFGNDGPSKT